MSVLTTRQESPWSAESVSSQQTGYASDGWPSIAKLASHTIKPKCRASFGVEALMRPKGGEDGGTVKDQPASQPR